MIPIQKLLIRWTCSAMYQHALFSQYPIPWLKGPLCTSFDRLLTYKCIHMECLCFLHFNWRLSSLSAQTCGGLCFCANLLPHSLSFVKNVCVWFGLYNTNIRVFGNKHQPKCLGLIFCSLPRISYLVFPCPYASQN